MLCTKLVIVYVSSSTIYNHVDMVVQSTGLCVCTVSYDVAVFVAQSLGEVLVCHACYGGDVDAAQAILHFLHRKRIKCNIMINGRLIAGLIKAGWVAGIFYS